MDILQTPAHRVRYVLPGATAARSDSERWEDGFNIRELGALGDGTANDGAVIATAFETRDSVALNGGVYRFTGNFTLAADKTLILRHGAQIKINNGQQFALEGTLRADRYDFVDESLSGTIRVGLNAVLITGTDFIDVPTIADAQALTKRKMASTKYVVILGGLEAYDGLGGGLYHYDRLGTEADDEIRNLRPVDFYLGGHLRKII